MGHKVSGHRTQSWWTQDTKPVDTGHKAGGHGTQNWWTWGGHKGGHKGGHRFIERGLEDRVLGGSPLTRLLFVDNKGVSC